MKVSAGILIINEYGEILLGHATGQNRWDIPKGGIDEGESAEDAARRELLEETSIDYKGELKDLGLHKYIPKKDLHLFYTNVTKESIDPKVLKCTSKFYSEHYGKEIFEMDDFSWIKLSDLKGKVSKSLLILLERSLTAASTDTERTSLTSSPPSQAFSLRR